MHIKPIKKMNGIITVPGDKSISHRAIMFGSIADGKTHIRNFLYGADCLSTISCFRAMGIDIKEDKDEIIVNGKGLHGLESPSSTLDVGNSGTTIRLISGILSAQNFDVSITGDASIQKRPMKRIIEPLSLMNANISSIYNNDCAPLLIKKSIINSIDYTSKVSSAQVKSAILLAGLYADGITTVHEPYLSRNHSELMLKNLGAEISTRMSSDGKASISISPTTKLEANDIVVPSDISSAAYFIAAALLLPNSQITIKNVCVNPTRAGIIEVCKSMGANIKIEKAFSTSVEEVADITVSSSNLHGITIGGSIIPTLIDEIPIIAIMACFASGKTIIKDAAELKVKESNRIDIMVSNLKAIGADVTATDDGMIINGGKALHSALIHTQKDHRIAMSFTIAGLCLDKGLELDDSTCVEISYPAFFDDLIKLL